MSRERRAPLVAFSRFLSRRLARSRASNPKTAKATAGRVDQVPEMTKTKDAPSWPCASAVARFGEDVFFFFG